MNINQVRFGTIVITGTRSRRTGHGGFIDPVVVMDGKPSEITLLRKVQEKTQLYPLLNDSEYAGKIYQACQNGGRVYIVEQLLGSLREEISRRQKDWMIEPGDEPTRFHFLTGGCLKNTDKNRKAVFRNEILAPFKLAMRRLRQTRDTFLSSSNPLPDFPGSKVYSLTKEIPET